MFCPEDQKRHSLELKNINHQLGQESSLLAMKEGAPYNWPTEGTVEIFSLSSFMNKYCSMFSASYLRKKGNIKQCSSFISCVQIETYYVTWYFFKYGRKYAFKNQHLIHI